jgi:hypothetical protein
MAKRGRTPKKKRSKKRRTAKGQQQRPRGKRREFGAAPATVSAGALAKVNRLELAELMGVHQDTISDYVRQGMPVIDRGGHGKEGVYDPAASLKWHRLKYPPNPKDLAMARQMEANAKMAELKLKERMLELVPREQIVREGQALVKAFAANVRALPSQLSQSGVIAREQEGAAARVCKALLTEIANWKTLDDVLRAAAQFESPEEAAS